MPIGNLTSQLFGNVYLNDFDHYITHKMGCKYYGRYVDDFFIVHRDKTFLKKLIPQISIYLQKELGLEIHPRKIYLQHYSKGVDFLGVWIKPYRIYICNRSKGQFYQTVRRWNHLIRVQKGRIEKEQLEKFLASINSYLGMLKHYDTYKLRKKMLRENLSAYFWNYVYVGEGFEKLVKMKTM